MDKPMKMQIILVAGTSFTFWILMSISMLLPGWYWSVVWCFQGGIHCVGGTGFATVLSVDFFTNLGDIPNDFRTTCLLMVASTVFLFISWVYACLQLRTYKKTGSFGSWPKPIQPVLLGLSALFGLAAVSYYAHKIIKPLLHHNDLYGVSYIAAILAVCFMLGLTALSVVIRYWEPKARDDDQQSINMKVNGV